MSLAMFAAPVNNNEEDDGSIINQRKRHNRTQKKYESNVPKPSNSSSDKVNSVLATIHESMSNLDDSGMGDFNPPPPPVSIGATRAKTNEERKMMQQQNGDPVSYENGENIQRNNPIIDRFRTIGQSQQGYNQGSSLDMNYLESNYVDDRSAQEYYSKYLPSMSNAKPGPMNRMDSQRHLQKRFQNPLRQMNGMEYGNDMSSSGGGGGDSHDVLMQKINYMINLLEDQQDEKVGNVGEEVVLYSFLGIFMIFLVDSFVRVGKYVR